MLSPGQYQTQKHNKNFSLLDYDCEIFWLPENSTRVISKGGLGEVNYSIDGSSTDNYFVYDKFSGTYSEKNYNSGEIGSDGYLQYRAPSYINSNLSNMRGFESSDVDIVTDITEDANSSNSMQDPNNLIISKALKITNSSSDTDEGIWATDTTSSTYLRKMTVWVKEVSGNVVDSSVCYLKIENPSDVDYSVDNTTRYRRIREDGWYQIYMNADSVSHSDTQFTLVLKPNKSVYVAFMHADNVYSDRLDHMPLNYPLLTTGSSNNSYNHIIKLQRNEIGASDKILKCGWMGICITMPFSSTEVNINKYCYFLSYFIDSDNGIKLYISDNTNEITVGVETNGSFIATIRLTDTWEKGDIFSLVFTWGYRDGIRYYYLTSNGSEIGTDIDIIEDIPSLSSTGYYIVGRYSDSISSYAEVRIDGIGIGTRGLSRQEAVSLSKWFQKLGVNNF